MSELKNNLKKLPTTNIHDSFTEYENYFVKHFGLKSTKATDLFNQVAAIKEIGQLNDFVRKHMLDGQTDSELLDQLYLNYENLSIAHRAILNAKEQLELLAPIATEANDIKELEIDKATTCNLRNQIPIYFNEYKLASLNKLLADNKKSIGEGDSQLEKINQEIALMKEQKNQLFLVTSKDQVAAQLGQIKMSLQQYQEKKEERSKEYKRYHKLAQSLELNAEDLNYKNFASNQVLAQKNLEDGQKGLQTISEEMYQTRKIIENKDSELARFYKELETLKQSNGRLGSQYLVVRDELVAKLGLEKNMLPFVAELIQVKPSENVWKAIIEKVLYSFAGRLLVPEEYYSKINQYLNKNKLNIRLVYNKVNLQQMENKVDYDSEGSSAGDSLFRKCDFLTKSPYRKWVQNEILNNYNYICTDNLKTFQASLKALMPSGLIKKGHSLHEKDDREYGRGDVGRSILGWDNKERLSELREVCAAALHEKDNSVHKLETLKKEISKLEMQIVELREFILFNDFNTIDWNFWADEIEKIEKQKSKLLNKDYSSASIRNDLEGLEKKLDARLQERDEVLAKLAITKNELAKLPDQIQACEKFKKELSSALALSAQDIWDTTLLEKVLAKRKIIVAQMTIDNIEKTQFDLAQEYDGKIKGFDLKVQHHQISLIRKMSNFKNKFSEQSSELVASTEYLNDFLKLKDNLEKEALPEHEKRFKNLLNKSVINDMAAFKSTLELTYENIEESIEQLNSSLKKIVYTPTTFVQLVVDKSKDIEIREFQNMLRNTLKVVERDGQDVDIEVSFERIKTILDKLKKEERWCKKVIDVRNWADFHVQEIINDSDVQKNYYADSAGLSGGQKAKLAFTILASALAYQYNLHGQNVKEKSFRFVVIDEAFSKSDEKNSQYAMELFKGLGLQLMVVTPKDKIQIVEPYVHSIFITKINEQQNYSQMHNLVIPQFTYAQH